MQFHQHANKLIFRACKDKLSISCSDSELERLAFFVVSNPFASTVGPQPVVGMATPYMTMAAPSGYGYFGAATPMPAGSVPSAVYGVPPSTFSVTNGMPVTNAPNYMNFTAQSGPQPIPQQQPQFAAWNQSTAASNPFMVN